MKFLKLLFLVTSLNTSSIFCFVNSFRTITNLELHKLKESLLEQRTSIRKWKYNEGNKALKAKIINKGRATNLTVKVNDKCYQELPSETQQQFSKIQTNTQPSKSKFHFVYKYGEEIFLFKPEEENIDKYKISTPYKVEAKPIIINSEEAAKLIATKKVLFYIGQEILAPLYKLLNEEDKKLELLVYRKNKRVNLTNTINNLIFNSEYITKKFHLHERLYIENPPTSAQVKLSSMAKYLKANIFAEGEDLFQKANGVNSMFVGSPEVKSLCTPENFQQIDLIICIGVDRDDFGFIHEYKKHNSNAQVLALTTKQPDFLDGEDMIIQESLEESIPKLWSEIKIETQPRLQWKRFKKNR